MSPDVMKNPKRSREAVELRRRAEAQLSQNQAHEDSPQMEGDTLRLIHELEVHQIELEMQNMELQQAQNEMDALLERYTDLYDFAPVGYFTLEMDGTVSQVNLSGARLLGLERSRLVSRRFGLFVCDSDLPFFNAFLESVFEDKVNKTCELTLNKEVGDRRLSREHSDSQSVGKDTQIVVQIEAKTAEDGQTCRAVVIDITERKRNEAALRSLEEQKVHRTEELETLTYVSATMRQTKTRAVLMPLLVVQSIRAMKSQTGILALIEGSSLEFFSGIGKLESHNGMRLPQDKDILWEIVLSGTPRVFDNLSKNNRDLEKYPFFDNLTLGLGACIIAPIMTEHTTIGLLIWGYSEPIVFSVNQMRLVTAITNMAGSAFHRINATEALEKMAANHTQQLTNKET